MPGPPPGLPGVVAHPAIARVAQRLRITVRELDRRLTVEDVLDEDDLGRYLHDVDVPPEPAPRTPPGSC